MANYNNLKAGIDAVIKTNGRQEISGAALNTQLKNMITELGAGYQYMGVATPATNPGTPDANVFYLASGAGTYTNFGGIVINEGEVCALVWNGTWIKQVTGIASADQLNQLGQKVGGGFSLLSFNGQGITYVFGEPVSLIIGHTYILELVSADISTISSEYYAYSIVGEDAQGNTVVVGEYTTLNITNAKKVELPNNLTKVRIGGRADVGGMIKAQLSDITLINDLENKVDINHSYFNGKGDVYTIGSWITGLIPGHTYRIYLDGISLAANYARFDIVGYSADNTTSQTLIDYISGEIPEFIDVAINPGIVKLRLGGRDVQDSALSIRIEDITYYDFDKLPVSNDGVFNSIVTGLYVPSNIFSTSDVVTVYAYNGFYSTAYQKYYLGIEVILSNEDVHTFIKKFDTLEELSAYKTNNRYIAEGGICYSFNADNIVGERMDFNLSLNPSCQKYGYYPECTLILEKQTKPQVQFTIPKLGAGTYIASILSETYCHNPYILENATHYIINYHSSENSTVENVNSDVSMVLIDKYSGEKTHLTVFKNNQETIDNYAISILYNNTAIMLDDNTVNIQVGCNYNGVWGSISRNFNIATGEFSAIEHQKLAYGGDTVDWNLLNYIRMCNTVFGLSLTEKSVVGTIDSFKRYKYNGTYYMVAGGMATGADNDVDAPVVLLTSADAITWTPIKVLFIGKRYTETEIAVANDRIYLVIRQDGFGTWYAIYDLLGNEIVGKTVLAEFESKPAVIASGTNVYVAFNIRNNLNPSMYWGRTKFKISSVGTSGNITDIIEYVSRNGGNYMDMVAKNNGNLLIAVIEDFRGFNNTPTFQENCTTDVMLAEVEIPF